MNRLFDAAIATAMSAEGAGRYGQFKVGSVLSRKGRLINAKTNSRRSHPALCKFTKYPFLHAESAVIISHGLDNCRGLDLIVARVNRAGNKIMLAKPCPVCQEVIRFAGIRRCWFSTDDGSFERLNLQG